MSDNFADDAARNDDRTTQKPPRAVSRRSALTLGTMLAVGLLLSPLVSPAAAQGATGQYSIRNGLSLIIIANSPNTLSANAYTMGDMFHGLGYATAIFGKWHLA